jgi:hypothetical protein
MIFIGFTHSATWISTVTIRIKAYQKQQRLTNQLNISFSNIGFPSVSFLFIIPAYRRGHPIHGKNQTGTGGQPLPGI